jgi:hypothetical protein
VAFFFLRKKPDWCTKTTLEEILFKKIMVAKEVVPLVSLCSTCQREKV